MEMAKEERMALLSGPRLWAGAFTGFYRPGVEEAKARLQGPVRRDSLEAR